MELKIPSKGGNYQAILGGVAAERVSEAEQS